MRRSRPEEASSAPADAHRTLDADQFLSNTYLVADEFGGHGVLRRRRWPRGAADRGRTGTLHAHPRPADPPPLRPRRRARPARPDRWPDLQVLAQLERAGPRRHRDDGSRRGRPSRRRSRSSRCTRPATPPGCCRCWSRATSSRATRCSRTPSAASARPAHTTYADLKSSIMDTLLTLPPETDPPRPHRPDDGRRRARAQRVRPHLARARPGGRRAVHRDRRAGDARPARRRLRRRPQGLGPLARRADDIVPGSRIQRADAIARGAPRAARDGTLRREARALWT